MKRLLVLMPVVIGLFIFMALISGCQEPPTSTSAPAEVVPPLTLEITTPVDQLNTAWGFTTVAGIVSKPEAVVTVNDTNVKVSSDGHFESDSIFLNEGKNNLTVTASWNGEEVSRTVTINYVTDLHVSISLNLKPGKDWYTVSPAEIGGRVSDTRAVVTVNGSKAQVSDDGYFSISLELSEGKNQITAIAVLGEQSSTDTREALYLPLPSLTLNIKSPGDGYEAQVDRVEIAGSVSDPGAEVTVNGFPARVTAAGYFSAYISLFEGQNQVDVVARRAEEKIENTIKVAYTPIGGVVGAELEIKSPSNGSKYHSNLIPVTGKVDEPSATVLINNSAAVVGADGGFQGYAVLRKGENSIEVDAIQDGARTSKMITVSFTPALVVYLDYPDVLGSDFNYLDGPAEVTGRVNKTEAKVTVNGEEVVVRPDGSFTTRVWLKKNSGSSTGRILAAATLGDERDEAYQLFDLAENGRVGAVPGYSHFFDASLRYESEISLKTGEINTIPVTLETRKEGPGKFYGSLFNVDGEYGLLPQPWIKGLDVYIEPPVFEAYPNTYYNFSLVFSVASDIAPSVYYLHFYQTFENGFYGSGWIEVTVE
jgi:hypothetical protein